jgi:hypothetical protein
MDFNYNNYKFKHAIICIVLVCKILAEELEGRLQETGKTSEYLELGYSIDQPKKKKEYKKS